MAVCFFCQVVWEFPSALFPFFYTNMLLAFLLLLAPICPVAASCPLSIVVSIMQSGNYTKNKLKGEKPSFGKLPPTAAFFGFTIVEFPRGGEKSWFINRHWQWLCPSNQPVELEAGVGDSPPLGKPFPVPAPEDSGRASLQAQPCSLKSTSDLAAVLGGQEKPPTRSSSGSLWVCQSGWPEAREALGAGYGASRLPAPRSLWSQLQELLGGYLAASKILT